MKKILFIFLCLVLTQFPASARTFVVTYPTYPIPPQPPAVYGYQGIIVNYLPGNIYYSSYYKHHPYFYINTHHKHSYHRPHHKIRHNSKRHRR